MTDHDDTIAEMTRLREENAALRTELKEVRASETSWKEMSEYWEKLCQAVVAP